MSESGISPLWRPSGDSHSAIWKKVLIGLQSNDWRLNLSNYIKKLVYFDKCLFHCFSFSWIKGSSPLPLFCVLTVLKYPPFFPKSSPHSSNKNYPGIFFDFKRLLNIVWHTSMRISCDKYNKRRTLTHYVIRRFTIIIYLWTILGLDLSNF